MIAPWSSSFCRLSHQVNDGHLHLVSSIRSSHSFIHSFILFISSFQAWTGCFTHNFVYFHFGGLHVRSFLNHHHHPYNSFHHLMSLSTEHTYQNEPICLIHQLLINHKLATMWFWYRFAIKFEWQLNWIIHPSHILNHHCTLTSVLVYICAKRAVLMPNNNKNEVNSW